MTSQAFKAALFSQETDEAFVVLLTITHTRLSMPIRVCSAGESVTSRGNTFVSYPFELQLAEDHPESPPSIRLTIDNVEQVIVETIRSITTPPALLVEIVRSSAPDTVEISYDSFVMGSVEGNVLTISAELGLEFLLPEPYPYLVFSPSNFPGAF